MYVCMCVSVYVRTYVCVWVTLLQSIHTRMRGHVLGIGTRACVRSTHDRAVSPCCHVGLEVNLAIIPLGVRFIHELPKTSQSSQSIQDVKHGRGARLQRSRIQPTSPAWRVSRLTHSRALTCSRSRAGGVAHRTDDCRFTETLLSRWNTHRGSEPRCTNSRHDDH